MEGLKEWATVVKALEQGKQTVILSCLLYTSDAADE